ncbi:FAD/NAD(P)-binding protein [Sphaerimonospora cavernae]|uniref:FAD/NAD(P)-binding protein n=1 Tax=Sphaerimonospora cavernae TaxID=1740611 RepID=A0ABV6UBB5_9ACTN
MGSGPRGIAVLERLAVRTRVEVEEAAAAGVVPRPVRIHLIDSHQVGAGRVWRTDQPTWFTMNTVISQVTMYSGEQDEGPARPGAGPSLGQWIAQRAKDLDEDYLGPNDYAPRVRYGEYLYDVCQVISRSLPSHVELHQVTGRVVAVRPVPRGGYRLSFAGHSQPLEVDRVVLTTGHPVNEPDAFERRMLGFTDHFPSTRYICADSAADMDLSEEAIPAGTSVGVRGLGLSFYDVMLSLTVGRGGRFLWSPGDELVYKPSGREPHIVAGSRSGLPIPARGRNQKEPTQSHRPLFLTRQALEAARRARAAGGSAQLVFAEDILPLLLLEVEHVYFTTHVRVTQGTAQAQAFAERHEATLRRGEDPRELRAEAGLGDLPPIDLEALARPFAGRHYRSTEQFTQELFELMHRDLAAASLGNVDGPLKAALDVLRDIRTIVREAVDFGGLLPESHVRDFHGYYLPLNSLLSAGPPMERVEQLRALIRQGVVEIAGPDTRFETDESAGGFRVMSPQVEGSERIVRTIIDARIPSPDLRRDTSELTQQLIADGMARVFTIPSPDGESFVTGGLDVTPAPFHVRTASGEPQPGLYALGIPTEHTRWFTQVGSSRPGVATLFYLDADLIAEEVLRSVEPQDTDLEDEQWPARRLVSAAAGAGSPE